MGSIIIMGNIISHISYNFYKATDLFCGVKMKDDCLI